MPSGVSSGNMLCHHQLYPQFLQQQQKFHIVAPAISNINRMMTRPGLNEKRSNVYYYIAALGDRYCRGCLAMDLYCIIALVYSLPNNMQVMKHFLYGVDLYIVESYWAARIGTPMSRHTHV